MTKYRYQLYLSQLITTFLFGILFLGLAACTPSKDSSKKKQSAELHQISDSELSALLEEAGIDASQLHPMSYADSEDLANILLGTAQQRLGVASSSEIPEGPTTIYSPAFRKNPNATISHSPERYQTSSEANQRTLYENFADKFVGEFECHNKDIGRLSVELPKDLDSFDRVTTHFTQCYLTETFFIHGSFELSLVGTPGTSEADQNETRIKISTDQAVVLYNDKAYAFSYSQETDFVSNSAGSTVEIEYRLLPAKEEIPISCDIQVQSPNIAEGQEEGNVSWKKHCTGGAEAIDQTGNIADAQYLTLEVNADTPFTGSLNANAEFVFETPSYCGSELYTIKATDLQSTCGSSDPSSCKTPAVMWYVQDFGSTTAHEFCTTIKNNEGQFEASCSLSLEGGKRFQLTMVNGNYNYIPSPTDFKIEITTDFDLNSARAMERLNFDPASAQYLEPGLPHQSMITHENLDYEDNLYFKHYDLTPHTTGNHSLILLPSYHGDFPEFHILVLETQQGTPPQTCTYTPESSCHFEMTAGQPHRLFLSSRSRGHFEISYELMFAGPNSFDNMPMTRMQRQNLETGQIKTVNVYDPTIQVSSVEEESLSLSWTEANSALPNTSIKYTLAVSKNPNITTFEKASELPTDSQDFYLIEDLETPSYTFLNFQREVVQYFNVFAHVYAEGIEEPINSDNYQMIRVFLPEGAIVKFLNESQPHEALALAWQSNSGTPITNKQLDGLDGFSILFDSYIPLNMAHHTKYIDSTDSGGMTEFRVEGNREALTVYMHAQELIRLPWSDRSGKQSFVITKSPASVEEADRSLSVYLNSELAAQHMLNGEEARSFRGQFSSFVSMETGSNIAVNCAFAEHHNRLAASENGSMASQNLQEFALPGGEEPPPYLGLAEALEVSNASLLSIDNFSAQVAKTPMSRLWIIPRELSAEEVELLQSFGKAYVPTHPTVANFSYSESTVEGETSYELRWESSHELGTAEFCVHESTSYLKTLDEIKNSQHEGTCTTQHQLVLNSSTAKYLYLTSKDLSLDLEGLAHSVELRPILEGNVAYYPFNQIEHTHVPNLVSDQFHGTRVGGIHEPESHYNFVPSTNGTISIPAELLLEAGETFTIVIPMHNSKTPAHYISLMDNTGNASLQLTRETVDMGACYQFIIHPGSPPVWGSPAIPPRVEKVHHSHITTKAACEAVTTVHTTYNFMAGSGSSVSKPAGFWETSISNPLIFSNGVTDIKVSPNADTNDNLLVLTKEASQYTLRFAGHTKTLDVSSPLGLDQRLQIGAHLGMIGLPSKSISIYNRTLDDGEIELLRIHNREPSATGTP